MIFWGKAICRSVLLLVFSLFVCSAGLWAQGDAAAQFKMKCAVCHGADGMGDTTIGKSLKIRDLHSPDVQKQTAQELTAIITDGKGGMPAYKDKLSASQIKDLVGYIRELGNKK